MKTKIFLIACTLCFASSFAQMKLADKFFKNYSYVKAIELYELVAKDGDSSLKVLTRLGDANYNNSNTEESAKWYQLAIDKYEDKIEPEYMFKYIQSLVSTKQYDKAQEWAGKLKAKQDNNPEIKKYILEDFNVYEISEEPDERRIVKLKSLDINSEYSDFGAYIKDNILYFASSRDKSSGLYDWNKEPFLDVYQTSISNNGGVTNFTDVSKIDIAIINSNYHESSIAITNDGNTLYFTRDNLSKNKKIEYTRDGTTHLKIYKLTKDEESGKWGNLEELPFNQKNSSNGHPALSPDNKKLFFVSDREGGFGNADIYYVNILDDGSYSEPMNVGGHINTPGRELFPSFDQNGTLYYSSDGLVNFGLLDVYKSDYLNNPQAKSENIGEPFNSSYDDFAYTYDAESMKGYVSSNREGGKGSDDIYSFNAYLCEQTIEGKVTDELTQDPISGATVKLIDDSGKVLKEVETDAQGNYQFPNLLCLKTYVVLASKDDYKDNQETVTTSDEKDKVNTTDLVLTPLIIDNQIVINPIFFDFDKSNIRTDAQFELENIVDVMRKHPNMVIKIESHTDSRGGDRYNMRLSDRRAKSTRDYIISRGIDASRIESAIGYGETQLLNNCSNGVKCSKEEHQKNRRSYFYIVKE